MRRGLISLFNTLCFLDQQIEEREHIRKAVAKENEACKRLMHIPGIGIMTVTMLLSIAGVASNFKNGREFAAFLGLVRSKIPPAGKQGFKDRKRVNHQGAATTG